MGQKKIKIVDLSEDAKNAKKNIKDTDAKNAKSERSRKTQDLSAAKKSSKDEKKATSKSAKKSKKSVIKKQRSRRYRMLKTKINRKKLYPASNAIKLLLKITNSKIDETVEIHISTSIEKLTGKVKLPHGTGKKQIIEIANEKLIDKISKGKIDFDILISSPDLMPKIARVAKILGPKGLMPNPKSGTISDNPKELKKKLEGGETRFKTEPKFPLIHFIIGKISFGEKKLLENLEALIKAVELKNIKKAVLTSTHNPGIKLEV